MEAGVRIFFPAKNIQPIFDDQELRVRQRPFVQLHKTRGFSLNPDFSNELYSINHNGFRGKDVQISSGQHIILALGESTTFGWGVRDDQTYPVYLNHFLNQAHNRKWIVINGGVPSYSSSQVLVTLQEILEQANFIPDLVLINVLWNDIWYSTVRNWHPDILLYQKPPGWLSFLTRYSRFCHVLVMGGAKQEKLANVFNEKALHQYEANIKQMIQLCRENGICLAFVEPPFDADHMPEKGLNEFHITYDKNFFIKTAGTYLQALHAIAQKHEVPVIAHGVDFRFLHQKDWFLDALHPTARGNAVMARDIFQYLLGNKFCETLEVP